MAKTLTAMPAGVEDRVYARMSLLMPFIIFSIILLLADFWVGGAYQCFPMPQTFWYQWVGTRAWRRLPWHFGPWSTLDWPL